MQTESRSFVGCCGFLWRVKEPKTDTSTIDIYPGSPSGPTTTVTGKGDASKAAFGATSISWSVLIVLCLRCQPKVASPIVQPVTIPMIDVKLRRGAHDDTVHGEDGATTRSVSGAGPAHCIEDATAVLRRVPAIRSQ
jgi:hypothetical protein